MRRSDLINVVMSCGFTHRQGHDVVSAVIESMSEAICTGDAVTLYGFGEFRVKQRAARNRRNPITGDEVHVPAHGVVVFKPAESIRRQVRAVAAKAKPASRSA